MSEVNTYSKALSVVKRIIDNPCTSQQQICTHLKELVRDGYTYIADTMYQKTFMNWGFWDRKIYDEFKKLNYDFSTVCPYQDILSPLLVYYAIRPLIQLKLFNKRLVEIGCGNGIGLKMTSDLLHTEYAVGIDLVSQLARNAHTNFYEENNIIYIQGDSEHLSIATSSIDIVTSIESSHLYPSIELFFNEVARILKPGGYFCYTDIHFHTKIQDQHFDEFLTRRNDLKIIQKHDITKHVQAAIHSRLITREQQFFELCTDLFGSDPQALMREATYLADSMGLMFLFWWKKRARTEFMRQIIKEVNTLSGKKYKNRKKCYFYYLVQKI